MRPLGTSNLVVLLVVLTALTASLAGCERRDRVDPGVASGELPDQEVADLEVLRPTLEETYLAMVGEDAR